MPISKLKLRTRTGIEWSVTPYEKHGYKGIRVEIGTFKIKWRRDWTEEPFAHMVEGMLEDLAVLVGHAKADMKNA